MTDLIESSNKIFLDLKARGLISQKELYFTDEFKKSTIPKRLSVVTGKLVTFNCGMSTEEAFVAPKRPVISNGGTPNEKASEFVDFHLKSKMQG